jgi:DNA-binding Lrp family transcriptional regulator
MTLGSPVAADSLAGGLDGGVLDSAGAELGNPGVVAGKAGVLARPDPFVVVEQAASSATADTSPTTARAPRFDLTGQACRLARRLPKRRERVPPSLCQAVDVPGTDRDRRVDDLDARLLRELDESPRVGVLELSRRLGVARGTVQARLDRLVERGVISSFGPTLDPAALGFGVTAFATLEIRQGQGQAVLAHLEEIPEVLEVHTITGPGDMLCRVVARSNADLQRVLDRVTQYPEIVRTSTVIALSNPVRHRVVPLV